MMCWSSFWLEIGMSLCVIFTVCLCLSLVYHNNNKTMHIISLRWIFAEALNFMWVGIQEDWSWSVGVCKWGIHTRTEASLKEHSQTQASSQPFHAVSHSTNRNGKKWIRGQNWETQKGELLTSIRAAEAWEWKSRVWVSCTISTRASKVLGKSTDANDRLFS